MMTDFEKDRPRRRIIVVVGSINMDLVCRTPALPRAGETVLGGDLQRIPGGKGANQAVAAARLGGEVHMIGRVGDDDFGVTLRNGVQSAGVDTTHVATTENASSGCAMIVVNDVGENLIAVAPGANSRLTPADIDAAAPLFERAGIVVLQLEIPLKTVAYTIDLCRRLGVRTILDPAPVPPGEFDAGIFKVDVMTPNEHEAAALAGKGEDSVEAIARRLLERGPATVVIKRGGEGSIAVGKDRPLVRTLPFIVQSIDTTAAGDAFTGALAVAMIEDQAWPATLLFANAAGALACTQVGAQSSLPDRASVDRLLQIKPEK